MFWKKHQGDSTLQLQDMSESPTIAPSSTTATTPNTRYSAIPSMAEIDQEDEQKEKPLSSFAKLRASILPSSPERPKAVDPCSLPQRRFFSSNDMAFSRARMYTVNGAIQRPHFRPLPDMAAHLPVDTAAFKLCAEFKNYSAGHYNVHWRVKALEDFSIPNGIHLVVNVWYETEPDISGTLDVVMPAHKLSLLAKDRWYNLTLEEKLVIQPHIGNCKVQVILCNNENQSRDEYTGLVVEHVEIRPMALRAEAQADVWNMVAKRAAIPNFTIDTAKLQLSAEDAALFSSPAPITRIAVSKGSRFLATLGMTKDAAIIEVYDMSIVRNPTNASKSLNRLYKGAAVGTIRHEGIGDMAIGLSLSTSGDQVALFQEPKIGQWADGAEVEKATFRFRLFNNPLVRQQNVVLNMDGPQNSTINEKSPDLAEDRATHDRNGSYNTADPPADTTELAQLIDVTWDKSLLQNFIGFGTFLPEMKKSDWEKNDVNSALGTPTEDENGDESNVADDGKPQEATRNSLFVTCNGLYLDVYEISPEKRWSRLHTITLSDLIPTLSRRITCKMMMEAISSNTFMWLEDGGRSCTIWNLLTGSNIAHISSIENARFKGSTFRGHTKMAISPHESIIALASVDGSLTTYFANTGMAIDDRKFPGYKIEHVGFHAQDDQLFVILRDSVTFELKSCILDTLQLKSQTPINQIPIPAIGTTALAFFYSKGYWNRGLICESDGSKINCYISYQPMSSKVNKANDTVEVADTMDVFCDSQFEETKKYQLQTGFHKELLPEGDGVSYFVHRVEVIEIEENHLGKTQRVIFSFVPEPWMRATTADVVHPELLLTAFFLPDWTRFAVNGVQSLQIWNLPTLENTKCSLQCFWSQPKDDKDLEPGKSAYKSTNVYDYYQDTLSASIYVDTTSWNTVAEIKMNEKQKKKMVSIPGPLSVGARYAITFCFRSIHLLAATYAYSNRESKRTGREGAQQSFTFEDHADAILRFTREHINRMMSIGVYSPKARPGRPYKQPKQGKSPDMTNKDVFNEKQGKPSPGGRLESPRPAAAAVALGGEGASASPSQAPIVVGDDITIHGNANRRQDDEDDEFHLFRRDREDSEREIPEITAPPKSRPDVVTILTLLLDHRYLKRTNHIFVEGLLNSANGDWIPRDNKALNPIKRAIEVRNGPLVEAFLEYCIKNAKKYHPAYLMPAVQCLNELSDRYPSMLADMFRKASYVPAHNYGYVASHAIIANHQYREWLKSKIMFWTPKFEKSNNVNDYERPVFSLRSQLPFRAMRLLNILNIETSIRDKRHNKFPPKKDVAAEDESRAMQSPYSHKIFVTPFPKLSMYGTYQPWTSGRAASKSAFTDIAGQDFFDSPAMVSTLEFKWHKFGFFYWSLRFLVVAIFFILVILITAEQVHIFESTAKPGADLQLRFMENWRPVFHTTTAFGFVLIAYEAYQFIDSPKKYLASPYNYTDLAAYVLPVVGCFLFLDYRIGKDEQPRQVWVLSFSILALYMNILFELRVIKQLGIVVNIILNITRRIVWFFLVFGLFIISFTHALLHLMKTGQYPAPVPEGAPPPPDDEGYPDNFWRALSATYFFLAGRYDPVSYNFDYGSTSFHIMMVIFNFFTAILLLNILIALMNDAFNESKDQGQLAWLKQWSEVIAEVEVFLMTPGARQNRNLFPDYIYYGANEQEAELYESKYYIASKSNLSIENRFLVDTVSTEQKDANRSQRAVLRDVQAIAKELEKLKSTQEGFSQDISQLTELMAAYLAQTTTTAVPTTASTTTVTTPATESELNLSQSPTSETGARVSPSSPTSPPPSAASTLGPSAPANSGTGWSSSAPPPPPGSAGAPPGGVMRSSAFGSWPKRGGMKQSTAPAAVQQSQMQFQGRPKISSSALETDSPTTYGPTVHFGAPGPSVKSSMPLTAGTLPDQIPGTGAFYYPEPSSSSSSSTRYKVVDMPDPAGGPQGKDNQTALKRRLQQKLAVVHTMDDALKSHQAREENNMDHPIYIQPHARIKSSTTTTTTMSSSSSSYGGHSQQVSYRSRRDSDDDGLYDDEEEEESGKIKAVQGHVHGRRPTASHPQSEQAVPVAGTSSGGTSELVPRRTQSDVLLTEVPHEPVPLHTLPRQDSPN